MPAFHLAGTAAFDWHETVGTLLLVVFPFLVRSEASNNLQHTVFAIRRFPENRQNCSIFVHALYTESSQQRNASTCTAAQATAAYSPIQRTSTR